MGRDAAPWAIGIIVVIVLLVVVVGSVRPTMVAIDPPAADSADGTVTPALIVLDGARLRGSSQSSGISLFGLSFGGSTTLTIEFPVAADCYESVDVGDDWPTDGAKCESAIPVAGAIVRRLRDPLQGELLVVEMSVSKDCYAVATGRRGWPTGLSECASEEGR